MRTAIKRLCKGCKKPRVPSCFWDGYKTCIDCLRGERRRKRRHKQREAVRLMKVVECIGDDRFHVALEGRSKTCCSRGNVVPLKFGQGVRALEILKDDPGCCEVCRAKLREVFQ